VSGTGAFVRVAAVSDVPPGALLGVTTPSGERVCLVNCGGEIRAVGDECPHQGFPLSAGELSPGGEIECVWHGARFDCRTGEPTRGPADSPLERYDVRIERGSVLVGQVIR
jgi:3-phenylpropionate/trans-cinnamate dioxygenase ferredoxin subunit